MCVLFPILSITLRFWQRTTGKRSIKNTNYEKMERAIEVALHVK